MKMSNLSVVHVVQGLLRAHVIKTYLESYGIPVALDYESAGLVYGITIDGLGEVRVLVPSRRVRRARRLLMYRHRPVPYRRRVSGRSRRRPEQPTGTRTRATAARSR